MSDLPEVIYLIKDSCRYEVVWSDSAFPYGDKKYISAEKAKADKLAMLERYVRRLYSRLYDHPDAERLLSIIHSEKQRIEAK